MKCIKHGLTGNLRIILGVSSPLIAPREAGNAWNTADPLKLHQEKETTVSLIENHADFDQYCVKEYTYRVHPVLE